MAEYYRTSTLPGDEAAIYAFIQETLRRDGRRFPRAIEVGCGPTIHHALALAPWVDELHLGDYLPANLQEVERWRRQDPQAHDWSVYGEGLLRVEGSEPTRTAIAAREQLLRERLTQLRHIDLRQADPLGDGSRYDLVASFYCADSITSSRKEWHACLRNLYTLVGPGGSLLLSFLCGAANYRCGRHRFPSAQITADDIREAFLGFGLPTENFRIEIVPVPEWQEEGFEAVGLAYAKGCAG